MAWGLWLTVLLVLAPVALAAGQPRFAESQQAITVTPVVLEREFDQGQRGAFEVEVLNQTERDFRFIIYQLDIDVGDSPTDDKDLVPAGTGRRGAGTWLDVVPHGFGIAAGDAQVLQVGVQVPRDAAEGGHYAAIVVRATPGGGPGVLIATELSVLVLLTVRGDIRRDLDLRVVPERRWWWSGPVRWRVEVRNRGNVHELVAGYTEVDGLFGTSYRTRFRPAIVLPGAERHLRTRHDVRSAPDLLRARARYRLDEDGDNDPPRRGPVGASAVVMPWWVFAAVALALTVIAWRLRQRRRWPSPDWRDDA